MQRMRRLIAGFLCVVMLICAIPMENFAAVSTENTPDVKTMVESTLADNLKAKEYSVETDQTENKSESKAADEEESEAAETVEEETEEPSEAASEEESEPESEASTEDEKASAETSEETTESTKGTEEETESTEATEESTEAAKPSMKETLPVETMEAVKKNTGKANWLYSLNEDGYAVIEGYTDYTAKDLSIPYTVDGYYVVAIGAEAFVNNTALSKMYIHGNVQTIADDAFDGLDVVLSGYNGTEVVSYASEKGMDFRLKSDQNYFKFKDQVIDFSYAGKDRYSFVDGTTIQMAMPEALQLSAGDVFFLPVAYEDLLGVYEVLSIESNGDYALITVQNAEYEDVLTAISIKNEKMYADWSQAEWEDGVEIIEEKVSGSFSRGGSVKLSYSKDILKEKAELYVETSLELQAEASLDIDLGKKDINELSFLLKPKVEAKGGIKVEGDNSDGKVKEWKKTSEKLDLNYKIGTVPIVSASGIISVYAGLYIKVSASGEVTISIGGSGELGLKWNESKRNLDGVHQWKWDPVTIDSSVSFELGPMFAVELHCAIVGKVASVEVFAGGVIEIKPTAGLWADDPNEEVSEASVDPHFCADVDIDGKVSLTVSAELKLLKDILSFEASKELFVLKVDIKDTHFEIRSDFVGFVDKCTFENICQVEFVTGTLDQIKPVKVRYNRTLSKPDLDTPPGNELLGWYKESTYINEWDFEHDKVTSDLTLYAKWKKTKKAVNFVTENKEVGVPAQQLDYHIPGTLISEPSYRVFKWKFNGWYLDREFTDKWDFAKDRMPDHDITLYSSWSYDESYNPITPSKPTTPSEKNYEIKDGKLYYNNHIYEHIASYELFSAARADAESRGGYLVTISSQEEMDAVLDYVKSDCAQQTLWLGINSTTGWKYWLNGEKLNFWNGSDPTTSSTQYNALFYRADGTWDTFDNSRTSHYIIEWGDDYEVDPSFNGNNSSTEGGAHYTESGDGKTASVVGFTKGEDIIISSIYDGLIVNKIDTKAFRNNTTVKTITIPSTVETIGDYAFSGCTALEEIVIPESVTEIGEHAFDGCTSLKKVILPSGLAILPAYIFNGCTSLEEIFNTEELTEIKECAFYNCSSLGSFIVSDKMTEIGNSVFYGCTALEKFVLNSALVKIGGQAFYNCRNLEGSIVIPEICTSIGTRAFYGCSRLEHVFLMCNQSAINNNAFDGVEAYFHGRSSDGIDAWCKKNKKDFISLDGTFRVHFNTALSPNQDSDDGTSLDDLYLTSGSYITEPSISREGYVLEGWYTDAEFNTKWDFARDKVNDQDITLYANWVEESDVFTYYVEYGNAYVSDYNGSESKVVIPAMLGGYKVAGIASDAFAGVDSMKSISIPSTVSVIEENAFNNCPNLYTIQFPNGNKNFKVVNGVIYSSDMKKLIYAAEGRTIVKFAVLDGVDQIYGGAFRKHDELSSVDIPASVTEIGENAFPTNAFIVLYGPDADCAAKKYAEDYGLSYNEYVVTFYDGEKVLFSAKIATGSLLTEYAGFENQYASYAGWYRDQACTEAWNFETDTMPAGNLSLYLKWNSDFAVKQGNGGLTITKYVGSRSEIVIPESIGGLPVTGIASGAFISTADAPIVSITIPDCVKEIEDQAVSGTPSPTIIANADSAAAPYAKTAGLQFEPRAYTITFDVNGGAEIAPVSYVPGEVPELPTPVKSYNYFLGWYTTNFYTTKWTETDVMPAQDITLYARWQVVNSQLTNDFLYSVTEDQNVVITGYNGTKTVISIPDTINGYPVTAIGDFAFAENTNIDTVTIPDSVLTIGEYAFSNSSVRTITGGAGVVSLGENCFSGAKALKTPFIPKGVKEIPAYCFEYCDAFADVIIPENVETIGEYAFYGCRYLERIDIAESVAQVGANAFAGCGHLIQVDIPSTLRGIDETQFGSAKINYYASGVLKILDVKQITKASVQISWNEVEHADGYKLYRKQGTSGNYDLIKTVSGTTTSNFNLKAGITYYYKVAAYQEKDQQEVVLAESEDYTIRIARLSTPEISDVHAVSEDSALTKWTNVVGAEGYEIWRAYAQDGEYTLLKSVKDAETVNSGLIGGRTYYYKVRAFYNDDGTAEYSAFSDAYEFSMPLIFMGTPENVRVRQTAAGTVLVEWDAVEHADGYNIYRKRGDGNLVFVKSTLSTSSYNYNLTVGETYSYAVEAYCNTDRETLTGAKSALASVTIATLATPYIKSVSQNAVKTALVSWTNVSAADGYELWRSRTENGTYALMKAVTGTATSNYNLAVGGTYYYKVRAYVKAENGEFVYSAYSNIVPITIISVAKTRLKSVVQADTSSAKITWAYMSGAKSYEVWRSVNDNDHYELLRTTSGTAIQDRNLIDGQTYYYKVRAYDDSGEEVLYGEFSDEMSLTIMGAPVIAALEQRNANSIYITWDKVNNADGYELWRSTDGSSFSKVKSVATAATFNYNLTAGETYYYKVRAFKTVDGTNVYGNYSKTETIRILAAPEITSLLQNGSNGVKIVWSGTANADGYELWKSLAEDNGVFTKVKDVTGISTTSFGLHETVVTYKLRPYASVNGKKIYGPYGSEKSITILGTPTFKEGVQASTSAVSLSWNEVKGAASYKLYRSTSPDSGFALLKTVMGTETKTFSLQSGNTYYFKLKAVMNENGEAHEGAYSEAIAVYVSNIVAPSIKSFRQDGNMVAFTASGTSANAGIELWRADASGEFVQAADSSTNEVVDTTCQGGETYQYKIRAYETANGSKVYSGFSSTVEVRLLAAPPFLQAVQTNVKDIYLEWELVDGADKYEVSRSADNGASYTPVGTFEGNTGADTVPAGGTYLYRVRAYVSANGNKNYSEWSSDMSATVVMYADGLYPETPHNYYDNQNQIYTYTKEGANALKLTFSAASNTESNNDYIYVLDGYGRCVAKLSGSIGGKTIVTAGETVQLYFTTDGSRTYYGFSFDAIEEASLDEAAKPIYTWSISGNKILTDGTGNDFSELKSRKVFSHLTEVEVIDGTTSLRSNIMSGMDNIKKVTLPDSLTDIGDHAFYNCTALHDVELPEKLENIKNYAFAGCKSITKVEFPESIKMIYERAFENCTALETVSIPAKMQTAGIYSNNSSEKGWGIFNGCVNLKNVIFGEGTEVIHRGLFAGSGLKSVTLPDTVTKIDIYAFSNCEQLEKVELSAKLSSIGAYAFGGSTKLKEVKIPDTISEIGKGTFKNCTALETVYIPSALLNLNVPYDSNSGKTQGIFSGCSNIRNVVFEDSVNTIPAGLFGGSGLKSIVIPDTVKTIGEYAFANCESLATVELPENLETMGKYAFSYDAKLRSVSFPDSIKEVGVRAFENCTALASAYIPAEMEYATINYENDSSNCKGWGIFNGCPNLKNVEFEEGTDNIHSGLFAGSGLKAIVIPDTVKRIGLYAFSNCEDLKTVQLPEKLEEICGYAFSSCPGLKTITLPENVVSIGEHAFGKSSNLKEVVFEGNTLEKLDAYCFADALSLEKINLPSSIISIENYAFSNCGKLKAISLGENVTSIGSYAFTNCTSLTELSLPASLTSIGSRAFINCSGLKEVTLPANFGDISVANDGIFYGCTELSNVIFAEGITKIPNSAFRNTGIYEITIPPTVTEIGSYAFAYCEKLRKIDLPEGLTKINGYAFQNCTILKRFTLPSTLTDIGDSAFQDCKDLTTLVIPGGISTVSSNLFNGCTSLDTVEISEGSTAINGNVFYGCTNLKHVRIPASVKKISYDAFRGITAETAGPIGGGYDYEFGWTDKIPDYAFSYLSKLTSVVIPDGITTIGYGAFSNSGLKAIVLPDSVTTVGNSCFNGCSSLEEVVWSANAVEIPNDCFAYDAALSRVVIPEGVTTIKGYAFSNCGNLQDIVIPSTVTSISNNNVFYKTGIKTAGPIGGAYDLKFGWTNVIPDYAFNTMTNLETAVIPDGITSIGRYAFAESGLKTVSWPASVTEIKEGCFSRCNSMTDFTWPASVEEIPSNCFISSSALIRVVIPDGVTRIKQSAFSYCTALKDITVPSSVTSIENDAFYKTVITSAGPIGGNYDYKFGWTKEIPTNAFYDMSNLTQVVIPDGITSVGNNAFKQSGLTSVSLPESVTTVGYQCFNNCNKLTEVNWSSNTATIPSSCFYYCTALTKIVLPEGVTTIEGSAFQSCRALKYVEMPSTVKSIANNAFYDTAITSAGPKGGDYDYQFGWTERIPDNAFRKMSKLTSTVIPEGITGIGSYAFGETGLKTISLPDSVTSVGTDCFYYCRSLTNVTWSANAVEIPKECFKQCTELTSFTVPNGVTSIKEYAFNANSKLTSITVPATVASIANNAFSNCNKSALIMYCPNGSYAAGFADANGITHQYHN